MDQQPDVVIWLAAVLSLIPVGVVASLALALDAWATRRWGPHPDRLWWLALGVTAAGVAVGALWVRVAT